MQKKNCINQTIVCGLVFLLICLWCLSIVIISHGDAADTENSKSGDTKSLNTKSQTSKPAASKPQDVKQQDVKPAASKPQDVKQQDVKPAASKPQDVKQQDVKPAASKPQDAKPQVTKPQVTKQAALPEHTAQEPFQGQKVLDLQKWENDLKIEAERLKVIKSDIDKRIDENNKILAQINAGLRVINDANTKRFQNIVTVYETMKAEEAAKSLSELDLDTLVMILNAMKVKKAAKILPFIEPSKAAKVVVKMSGVMKNVPKE